MELVKDVTVSKQGGLCINIPKFMCKVLDIKAGDKLTLSGDTELPFITMFKKIEEEVKIKIYKMQKPIYGDMTNCLIYDERHKDVIELPMDETLSKLFGDDYKIYVTGYIDEEGKFIIGDKVEEQAW